MAHDAELVNSHRDWFEKLERGLVQVTEKVDTMSPTLARLDNEFFNHDGEKGLKTLFIEDMAAREAIRREREKRESRQLAIAGIIVLVLLPPASWASAKAVGFFQKLSDITTEWDQIHKAGAPAKRSLFDPSAPVYSNNNGNPQNAVSTHELRGN